APGLAPSEGEEPSEGLNEGEGDNEGEGPTEGMLEGAVEANHTADQNADYLISLSELLRVIQFFNTGALHCDASGEDGFNPGSGDQTCALHSSDYAPHDWSINLSELLRLIQFFNTGAYHPCPGSEDNFCPGL
ncbi:MAG TPA: hypothetical protein PLI09_12920, partial [Candidatus Hydrogenedentes bacterium]|nr:hypothetical protein [Candidatus Hydrogenedentota bacterium]